MVTSSGGQATLHIGDVRDVMAAMPDASVDLVLTSPPFLALRSYLPADHPDKHREIGSEPTPATFLDTMLGLTAEWGRLITATGSIAVEFGDTYAGSGGAGGDYNADGLRAGQEAFNGSASRRSADGWPLDKSLCLIPELYAIALAYGINPLTGAESPAGRWRVRNFVAWCRPNPPVGALGDKVRPATSYITIATRARDRWFDLDAVRTPQTEPDRVYRNTERKVHLAPHREGKDINTNLAGAPPLDHWWHDDTYDQDAWMVSTEAYKGSHYATWPRKLLTVPIDSMCPRQVCTECGEPRRRTGQASVVRTVETLGWSDCGHGTFRPGVVLDPFAGSGTTLAVATGMGRDAIGIDLDARNAELVAQRVGSMFLDIIHHPTTRSSNGTH